MTNTGWVITIGYSVLVIVGVGVALIVFRSTRVGFHAEQAGSDVLEKREAKWGMMAATFLIALLALTIFEIPYARDTGARAAQRLQITGRQYAWTVNPPRIRAGVPTAVDVHAADVSHAVGLYDPAGRLIKQVNVLPGVTQRFVITLRRPGSYPVRCLEFCGVDHHLMRTVLEVTR